ncbi:MAG TPA: Ig-like domain-containing protein [Chitinophagaceae bacterium]
MKRIIGQSLLAISWTFLSWPALAQINQHFNTTSATPDLSQIKSYLQGQCWVFADMDINTGAWNPGLEGDGAMVSGASAQVLDNPGIYSPVLDLTGSLTIGFTYKFNNSVSGNAWLKLLLLNHNNEVVSELDKVQLAGKNQSTAYSYNNTISNLPSGPYKLHIKYMGLGSTKIAIDQLQLNADLFYSGGCNKAPIAVNDNITGNSNRTASGKLFSNDFDPDGDAFSGYVITYSQDGTVLLGNDGSFTFTPKSGFTGSSTSFTYQVCDQGFSPACGNIATVSISFTAGMLPVRLADFTVSVNNNNDAVVRWTTTYEQGSDRFEIERSFDGATFETAGTIKGAGTSFAKNEYSFTDRLRNSITNKKDVYYRIRMIDVNSRAEASKVLVLRLFRTGALKMISVTPNPAVNDINVQVQLKENSYVVMKVTNSSGTEVSRKSIRGSEGLNVFSLEGTGRLLPGTYMLEVIINSNERMTTKLVKNN